MRGSILMSHFLMTKIATARAKQEQRNQDAQPSELWKNEYPGFLSSSALLLSFCVCVKKRNVSSAHSFFVQFIFIPHTTLWLGAEQKAQFDLGLILRHREEDVCLSISPSLSIMVQVSLVSGPSCFRRLIMPWSHATCEWSAPANQRSAWGPLTNQRPVLRVCTWLRPSTHCCLVTWGRMCRFPHSEVKILPALNSQQ